MAEQVDLGRHVSGFEVYQWPEFKALCDRLGIAWDKPTLRMAIYLDEDSVYVVQDYQGRDQSRWPTPSKVKEEWLRSVGVNPVDEPAVVDTTCVHNKEYRTSKVRGS